jgi:hypothetical protein
MNRVFLFFLLLLTNTLLFAQKDSIVLNNNDVIIGEIKGLDKSVLTFKTPYSDSDFKIKWQRVKEVYSNQVFIVALSNGDRFTASIETNSANKHIVLLNAGGYILESVLKEIIFLDAIGQNFLSRLDAEFDLGITLTKANNSKQFTANALLGYVANKWSLKGSFKTVLSSQDDVDDIKRIEGDGSFQWFLPKDWFLSTSVNLLSNNEQKLQLRTTGKLGGGYYFIHNNSMSFGAGVGLAFNNETYTDPIIPSKNSLEAYLGTQFNKYDIGDLSLLTSAFIYPSLTESGRFRADFNLDLKYDLPWDFYIKTGITYNFDNQPVDGASKEDYVLQTSFGWELKM